MLTITTNHEEASKRLNGQNLTAIIFPTGEYYFEPAGTSIHGAGPELIRLTRPYSADEIAHIEHWALTKWAERVAVCEDDWDWARSAWMGV